MLEINYSKTAMNIILQAGNARTHSCKSMQLFLEGKIEEGKEELKEAKACIKNAHLEQTNIMQELARREYEGNHVDNIPMLFIHAQDTLMTIMSEVNIIELMEQMYIKLSKAGTDE